MILDKKFGYPLQEVNHDCSRGFDLPLIFSRYRFVI